MFKQNQLLMDHTHVSQANVSNEATDWLIFIVIISWTDVLFTTSYNFHRHVSGNHRTPAQKIRYTKSWQKTCKIPMWSTWLKYIQTVVTNILSQLPGDLQYARTINTIIKYGNS